MTSPIRKHSEKPLFTQFNNLVSNYGYVLNTICNLIYYLFYGPKLIDCLRESIELNRTYHRHISERKAIIIILSCIIICYCEMFLAYFDLFLNFNWSNELMKSILMTIACHLICVLDYFSLHSLFYGEWLIRRSLYDLLCDNGSMFNERKYIQNLASTCDRFHSLQSLPLLIYCTNNVTQMVMIICWSLMFFNQNIETFIFTFYLISITIYIVYIVHINECTLTIFDHLMTLQRIRKHRTQSPTEMIGTYELEQYRNCFRLKLFHLTYLNMNVLFTLLLSVISLTVFIMQTN